MRRLLKLLLQSLAIIGFSAVVAIGTNALRSGGIPLVTNTPYDIFAECRDAEAEAVAATEDDLTPSAAETILYIDARPAELFGEEHVDGAINVPYSALFGAQAEDMERVKTEVSRLDTSAVMVYGAYTDPSTPANEIDFGKPLAAQLTEAGIPGVKHVEGGLRTLKKMGLKTVKAPGNQK